MPRDDEGRSGTHRRLSDVPLTGQGVAQCLSPGRCSPSRSINARRSLRAKRWSPYGTAVPGTLDADVQIGQGSASDWTTQPERPL